MVDGGKAKLHPVKSGISDETSVVLLEGLKGGETVVTGPYRSMRDLKHGDAVKERKEKEPRDDEKRSAVRVE